DEQDLFKLPSLQAGNAGKQDQHEAIARHRRQNACKTGYEEISLVSQPRLGILGKVMAEYRSKILQSNLPEWKAGALPRASMFCSPKTRPRSRTPERIEPRMRTCLRFARGRSGAVCNLHEETEGKREFAGGFGERKS